MVLSTPCTSCIVYSCIACALCFCLFSRSSLAVSLDFVWHRTTGQLKLRLTANDIARNGHAMQEYTIYTAGRYNHSNNKKRSLVPIFSDWFTSKAPNFWSAPQTKQFPIMIILSEISSDHAPNIFLIPFCLRPKQSSDKV